MGQPGTGDGGFGVAGVAPTPNTIAPAASSGGGFGVGTGGFDVGPTVTAPAPSGGGGGIGGFFHSIGNDLGSVAHYVSTQGVKAADLGKQIGTGLYGVGKEVATDDRSSKSTDWGAMFSHPERWWHAEKMQDPQATNTLLELTKGQYEFAKTALEHPGRNIAADILAVAPLTHVAVKGGLLATGKGALLDSPRLISESGREPVSLYASHNAARRLVQAGIDKVVNKALANDRAKGVLGHEGPVAKYGRARMGGTIADYSRAAIRYRQAMVSVTRGAARGVEQFAKSIKAKVDNPELTAQALLHSLHDNVLPEHEAIFHEQQAAKGINPEQNRAWATAFNDAAKLDVVHNTEDGKIAIAAHHPLATPLLKADSALEKLGAYAENQIVVRGLRSQEALAERNGRVNQLIQRGEPLRGKEPQALTEARRALVKAQDAHAKNLDQEASFRNGNGQKTFQGNRVSTSPNPQSLYTTIRGKQVPLEASNPYRDKVVLSGQKLEDARQRVQQFEDRYGISSPERREAQKTGIQAREQIAEAAHRLYGDATPAQLAQIESYARQYARTHDVTPEEFYADALRQSPSAPDPASLDDLRQAVENAKNPADGGFTLNQDLTLDRNLQEGEHAVSLAPYEERIPAADLTPEAIASYAAKWRGVLEADPSLRVGGWLDPTKGIVYLDITKVMTVPREAAMDFARSQGQLAVTDRGALSRGDRENAFPETRLDPAEADMIKAAARARIAPNFGSANDLGGRDWLAHSTSEAMLQNVFRVVRRSLAPVTQEVARRMYAPNGWDRAGEERFVSDMEKAQRGEPVSPEVRRLFTMTHEYLPGRGYVPMSIWEDARTPHSPMAAAPGPIVGEAKNPLEARFATGEATAQGMRRTDVAESVISHVQKLFRYFNTVDQRDLSAQHGSDTRLSNDDTLMRYDRRTEAGFKLPAGRVDESLKEALGLLENKTGLPAPEEEGLSAGVSAVLQDLVGNIFPGHFSPHTEIALEDGTKTTAGRVEREAQRGEKAPPGYVWVPKQLARLKDLEAAVTRGEPTQIGRFVDNTNGAVTAATVYYKFGHFFTRYFTNAAANLMQGSLAPRQAALSVRVWRSLSEDEQREALAYAGTHYYEAAPGATGSTAVGRSMQKGLHIPFTDKALRTRSGEAVMSPQFWAHNVDAPFRFNSIAYEARHAGYEGADGFRQFLQDVRSYNTLDAEGRARVDGVLRRADREAIAYDRLNQFEKKYLARAIWFYPWIKGATVFTGNAILEHPFKSAVLGNLGSQGEQQFQKDFGDMPSYANGLTELTGGAEPVVSDLNTFSPASTAADLALVPAHLANLGGMLNPAVGAVVGAGEGVNSYGAHTPSPILDNAKGLLGSAPEYQVASALLDHGDQAHRLYPGGHGLDPLYKNWLGELVRAFASPAMLRHVNPNAGHSLAQRERTGH